MISSSIHPSTSVSLLYWNTVEWMMEWKMEWNGECTCTVADNSCDYLVYLWSSYHCRGFMSKSGVAHMPQYPSMVLYLAHHQMLSNGSLAKPDSHSKARVWLHKTI